MKTVQSQLSRPRGDIASKSCLLGIKLVIALVLCLGFMHGVTSANGEVPPDKIIHTDIVDPAARGDIQAVCLIDEALQDAVPPPWELCELLWGQNIENAWQRWKQDYCDAYDPHKECFIEALSGYDSTKYEDLKSQWRAKFLNMMSHNALIDAKCDEIKALLKNWRKDAKQAAQERNDEKIGLMQLKGDLADAEGKLDTLESELSDLEEDLKECKRALIVIEAARLAAIAVIGVKFLKCLEASLLIPYPGNIVAILLCGLTAAIELAIVEAFAYEAKKVKKKRM